LLDERAAYKIELAKRNNINKCEENTEIDSIYGNKINKNKLIETIKRNKDIDKEI
jgi:hypothetical protein